MTRMPRRKLNRLTDEPIERFAVLKRNGPVSPPVNIALFTIPDSRFMEIAGLKGTLAGSYWVLLTCFLISFPIGIGAADSLEEFEPRNRVRDFIEVSINYLAAVPSVVFGLLPLAVFVGWIGLPRSVQFFGGMTLALITMPTVIIAARAALKSLPGSIRESALGVGGSAAILVLQGFLIAMNSLAIFLRSRFRRNWRHAAPALPSARERARKSA